jgi:hypothetical protein
VLLVPACAEAVVLRDDTAAAGGARNCIETDVELVLPTGAEVLHDWPRPACAPAPGLCASYNLAPCGPDRHHNRGPPPEGESER